MSTRCSFGFGDKTKGEHEYHLFEDFVEPGMVFLELPREVLDEMDSETVTLRMTPELWDAIRKHACPGVCPKDRQIGGAEEIQAFVDSIKPKE